ncbi:MAG: hypothetical protein ACPIOQ_14585 [Promethearchaeia archaeon]
MAVNLPETVEQTPNTRDDARPGAGTPWDSLPMMKINAGKCKLTNITGGETFTGGGVAVQAASAIATASSVARWSLSRA